MKKLLLTILFFFIFSGVAHAQTSFVPNLVPLSDSTYRIGSTSPLRAFLQVIADSFYDTDASDGCATWSSNVLTSTGAPCGGGGSLSGGTAGTVATWVNGTTLTGSSTLNINAINATSTTASSSFNQASTTISTISKAINIIGSFFQVTFGNCDGALDKVLYNSTTGKFSCGVDQTSSGSGVGTIATSSQETAGQIGMFTTTNGYPARQQGINTSTPSVTYPVQYSGTLGKFLEGVSGAFSLAFGTTTANIWSAVQTFTSGLLSNASSTLNSLNFNGTSSDRIAFNLATGTSLIVGQGATTSRLGITSITNCDTLDTDSVGNVKCGTDATGGAGTGTNTPSLVYAGGNLDRQNTTTNQIILGASNTSTLSRLEINGGLTVHQTATATTFVATSTGSSTFNTGVTFNSIASGTRAVFDNGTSTFRGLVLNGKDCSGLTNGGALTINSSGEVVCSNDDGGAGGSQTPWTSNIDGGGFGLNNASYLHFTGSTTGSQATFGSSTIGTLNATSSINIGSTAQTPLQILFDRVWQNGGNGNGLFFSASSTTFASAGSGGFTIVNDDDTSNPGDVLFNPGVAGTVKFTDNVGNPTTYIASSTSGTTTLDSNAHVVGNLKIGPSSIMLRSGATSTFDAGFSGLGASFSYVCLTGDSCRTTWPTGGGSGVGTVSTSSAETKGQVAIWSSTNGYPATLMSVASTSLTLNGPFTGYSALGALIGGSNSTINWTGLATTSQPSSSNLLVSNGGAGVYGAATGTVANGTGISVTAGQSVIGSGLTITNTGVTSLAATYPIQVSGATGAVTVSTVLATTGPSITMGTATIGTLNATSALNVMGTTTGNGASFTYLTLNGGNLTGGKATFTGVTTTLPVVSSSGTSSFATLSVSGFATTSQLSIGRGFFQDGFSDCSTAGTSKVLYSLSSGKFSCGTDQTGGGSSRPSTYSYIVDADGLGDFTTIQGALDACAAAGGGSIYLSDHYYYLGGTGLKFKSNDCNVYGVYASTTIEIAGATTAFSTNSAASTYANNGVHNVVIVGDGNTGSIGIDMSDMIRSRYTGIVMDNLGRGFRLNDTQNVTFYNTVRDFALTTIQVAGIDASSTNPTNDNKFSDGFIGCAVSGCIGINLNNAQNNLFYSVSLEPATAIGTIGVKIDVDNRATNSGTFANQFYGLYAEANKIGIAASSSISATKAIHSNGFFGGQIVANTTDTLDSSGGESISFFGVNINYTQVNQIATTTFTGNVGIGTSTPWAALSVISTTATKPIIAAATSTLGRNVFLLSATSSTFGKTNPNYNDDGIRMTLGVSPHTVPQPNLDQLTVEGRMNAKSFYVGCDYFAGSITQLAADTNNVCQSYMFNEDAAAVFDPASSNSSSPYARVRTGATGVSTVAGDGGSLTMHTSANVVIDLASSTPIAEIIARIGLPQNATSSIYTIGFSSLAGNNDVVAAPSDSCLFTASSTAATGNWYLQAGGGTAGYTNTGVASTTSVSGNGDFYKFRLEANNTYCTGYITNLRTGVVTMTRRSLVSWPNRAHIIASVGGSAAGLTKELHVKSMRLWLSGYDEPQ